MEVLVAVAIIGTVFVSLYLGMTQGFAIVQVARENLRATQILQEKTEIIRLYTWDQINTAGFIPPTIWRSVPDSVSTMEALASTVTSC